MALLQTDSAMLESLRVKATSGQVSSDLAGESVILDLRSGVYYGLNEVGAKIWALVQQPQTIQSIQHALLQEYDVDPEICVQDILHLLQDLQSAGLVEMDHYEPSA